MQSINSVPSASSWISQDVLFYGAVTATVSVIGCALLYGIVRAYKDSSLKGRVSYKPTFEPGMCLFEVLNKYNKLLMLSQDLRLLANDPQALLKKNDAGEVPLHRVLLNPFDGKHYTRKQILSEFLKIKEGRESLLIKDSKGNTPLNSFLRFHIDKPNYLSYQRLKENDLEEIAQIICDTKEGRESLLEKDESGNTPLHYLVQIEGPIACLEVVIGLHEGRAALKTANGKEDAPLHIALKKAVGADIVKVLIKTSEGKAAVSMQDSDGNTPVHLESGLDIIGTDVGRMSFGIRNKDGHTPVHLYCAKLNIIPERLDKIFKLKEGKDALTIQDNWGNTPVHILARTGNYEVMRLVLTFKEGRAALSIQTHQDGYTPLHIAAQGGLTEREDIILKKERRGVRNDEECVQEIITCFENSEMPGPYIIDAMLEHQEGRKALTLLDKKDYTPFHTASRHCFAPALRSLVPVRVSATNYPCLDFINVANADVLDLSVATRSDFIRRVSERVVIKAETMKVAKVVLLCQFINTDLFNCPPEIIHAILDQLMRLRELDIGLTEHKISLFD